jgi:hypothetical protein
LLLAHIRCPITAETPWPIGNCVSATENPWRTRVRHPAVDSRKSRTAREMIFVTILRLNRTSDRMISVPYARRRECFTVCCHFAFAVCPAYDKTRRHNGLIAASVRSLPCFSNILPQKPHLIRHIWRRNMRRSRQPRTAARSRRAVQVARHAISVTDNRWLLCFLTIRKPHSNVTCYIVILLYMFHMLHGGSIIVMPARFCVKSVELHRSINQSRTAKN